jgi:carboxypeptidase C (cathepsin A)
MPEETPAKTPRVFTEEEPTVTDHLTRISGQDVAYQVTAGRLPIKDDEGVIKAQIFYMAYKAKDAKGPRPLIFCFNGGPGSPSLWLHMGVVGPLRIPMFNDGDMPAPPYSLVPNDHSWLPFADLVFVDPVGTGYSEAIDSETAEKYWSVKGDIESLAEFIRLFMVRNQRFGSPVYMLGESYGTTRVAGLSKELATKGIAFNGLILVSSILNFQTADFSIGNDLPPMLYIPTYAATAWYHNAIDRSGKELAGFLNEARVFAEGEYATALTRGNRLTEEESASLATKLTSFTGLSVDYLEKSNLRIEIMGFCKELLRERGQTVGRLDSRIIGADADQTGQKIEHDPSMSALMAPYTMAFQQYVGEKLNYKTDLPYHIFYGIKKPWKWDTPEVGFPDTSEALRDAMLLNPHMKVFVASGLYDLATPFFATEYTVSHLGLPKSVTDARIAIKEYPAGHMMYTHEGCLADLTRDVKDAFFSHSKS